MFFPISIHICFEVKYFSPDIICDWCHCYDFQVQAIVDAYKNANLGISQNCKAISELLLVRIDGKSVHILVISFVKSQVFISVNA